MKSKTLRMIFPGVLLSATFAFAACCTHSDPVFASTKASQPSTSITTLINPLPHVSPSWVRITPAQVSQNGQINIGNGVVQLPVKPGQHVQYVLVHQRIYWSLSGSLSQQLWTSVLQQNGNGTANLSTRLVYTTTSVGKTQAPSIQLFNGGTSVFFTTSYNGKLDKDLYQVSGTQAVQKLFTLTWTPREPLYTFDMNGNNLYASVSNQFPYDPILIDALQGAGAKQMDLPYWPLNIVVFNQQIYLVSGPDTYLFTTNNDIKPYTYIPQGFTPLVSTVTRQWHSHYLMLPSLYFQNQIRQPYELTTTINSSSSYTLSLVPKTEGIRYKMEVFNASKSTSTTDYTNWIDTLNSFIANASNKSVITNTATITSQPIASFFGKQKVVHQFVLQSSSGPWMRWSLTASKKGNPAWYVTWGTHGWLYNLGPLFGPNDPSSQVTLNRFIGLSKQNPLQPVSPSGEVNIKLAWNLGSATPTESLYEYTPTSGLSVKLDVSGFAGWHDLANFSMINTDNVNTTS